MRDEPALAREDGRAGEALPPFLPGAPADHDMGLAGLRPRVDGSRHAAEEDALALEFVDGPAGRAVERGPDNLGADPRAGCPRRSDDSHSPFDGAGEDAEAVVPFGPAREAGRVSVVLEAGVARRGRLRLRERHRLRHLFVRVNRSPRPRDDDVAVPELVPDDVELRVEWRRYEQGHLEASAERFGEEPARIAAVRRAGRPVEARGDDHRSSVSVMTPNGGRASV
jgi:hypothetical protein